MSGELQIEKGWVLLGMAAPKSAIDRHVAKLCNSAPFGNAPVTRKLLKYLVQEALEGRIPQREDVAKALGKKALVRGVRSFSKVRMAMKRVREKLDEYYVNNPNPAEVRIIVPLKHYFLMTPKIVGTDRAPIPVDSVGKPASVIMEPREGAEVYARVTVRGRIADDLDRDLSVWLVVGVSYLYYPQCRVSRNTPPEWQAEVRIGRLPSPGPDEGGLFDINLVAAGADGDAEFHRYKKAHGDGFAERLPGDVTLLDSKRVIRRDIRTEA